MLSRVLPFALALAGLLLAVAPAAPAVPGAASPSANAGYVDFSFFYSPSGGSTNAVVSPTGEKPQSKLWYHDGRWWADLFSPAARAYHIFALSWATQKWVDTGVAIDDRPQTKADCLWDGARLYVVSGGGAISTGRDLDARLYRYSYAGGRYRLDPGFPVVVRQGGAETIVIAKDSVGTLWVTYTQNNQVYLRRSSGSDLLWGAPFVVPASGVNAGVAADDISSIVAYGGRVGVLWSNQTDGSFYLASHVDGAASGKWSGQVIARRTSLADDHLNLKSLQSDPAGSLYAVVKTSLAGDQPSIVVLVGRPQSNGQLSWRSVTVTSATQSQTRPIVLIDTSNRAMYVFTATEGGGSIYMKSASLDNLAFDPSARGTPFISQAGAPYLNDPTSTKQNVSAASGLVVLASYDNGSHPAASSPATDVYAHNAIDLPAPLQDRRVFVPLARR